MSSIEKEENTITHWRSTAELDNTPDFRAFLEAEFPEAADPDGLNRRRWLQLMGASFALAGLAGCKGEDVNVLPFVERPVDRAPGKPQRFATAMELGGSAVGLMVTSIDGRPIKVEGNPGHPQSLGASSALAQASILELYDPDRSRMVVGPDGKGDWSYFCKFARPLFADIRQKKGKGLRILSGQSTSPTQARLAKLIAEKMPEAKWFGYDPVGDDNAREGAKLAFGQMVRTGYALDNADVIVSLDADLLGTDPAALQHARAFAKRRDVDAKSNKKMNRLYVIESSYSVTGGSADHRLALSPSQITAFAAALHAKVAGQGSSGNLPEKAAKYLSAIADDLAKARGRCVVAVGESQPPAVHAAAHAMNDALGNAGKTVSYYPVTDADRPLNVEAISSITEELNRGDVETLVLLGGNPAYDAPVDLGVADAIKKAKTVIHLSLYRNETTKLCDWHVPQAHFLEDWGDTVSIDGTYSVIQPLIAPLHGGKSAIDFVSFLIGDEASGKRLVDATYSTQGNVKSWRRTLLDGYLETSPLQSAEVAAKADVSIEVPSGVWSDNSDQLELAFAVDSSVYDGRFANNGWLQELPDPLTKLTWDNAALISPKSATALGVKTEDVITINLGDRSLDIPVYVLHGHADGTITLPLGYGRTAAGKVGGDETNEVAPVGANTYTLRTSSAMNAAQGARAAKTGRTHRLASTQDHHAIDTTGQKERAARVGKLIRTATVDYYHEHPDFAKHVVHHPPLESLWPEHEYNGHRWGMSIDLNKCIGCNGCVAACQAENNVPIVGKDQVLRGREMHWIRIDRYFTGDPEDPDGVAHQPLACHHCELAPCEQVCPVNATVHSHEGLNDMVYNRCIGTRYCGNNCPYKVRRFNYFNYHEDLKDANNEISKMVLNPEVTVRHRGVMEKCTYCVQRIQAVKIDAKNNKRPIEDGEIQTACQQACPTRAITFGDLGPVESEEKREKSAVAKAQQSDRAYAILAELNIKPRTMYLARISNPNPALKEA
jgi:MoCo/4Fe-4S cofactor protein with predicted Tat translocation signal